ncbi:MAG: response regulator, partial [Candidatus Falkowbacteria bacterium]
MSKTILIIEDEKYLSDMYRLKFEHRGFKVITSDNGRAGLEAARKNKPDLILLDLIMPVMNGYEVLKEFRRDKDLKDLKVYIWSNLSQASEIKKGLLAGADGYFVKTNMTPGQLAHKIEELLRDKGAKDVP